MPYLQAGALARALTEAGVPVRLVPIEGADHIFNSHDDIDGVVRRDGLPHRPPAGTNGLARLPQNQKQRFLQAWTAADRCRESSSRMLDRSKTRRR